MKQKIFTKASFEYLQFVENIKELASEFNLNASNLIYGYDITLQTTLMNIVLIDKKITEEEIEFLSKIVYENDIIKIINAKKILNNDIDWNILSKIKDINEIKLLINSIYKLFLKDIDKFILEFVKLDSLVDNDYLNLFKANIYKISELILSIDGLTEEEKNECFHILNDLILKKMDNVKNIMYN